MRTLTALVVVAGCAPAGEWRPMDVEVGVPYIEVELDEAPMTCLLDTGFTGEVAVRSTLASTGEARLRIGSVSERVEVRSEPSADELFDRLGGDEIDVDCLVGWEFVRSVSLTLDYAADRFRVQRSGRDSWRIDDADLGDPVHAGFTRSLYVPVVFADVGLGEDLVVVDTGASVVNLEPAVYAALPEPPETEIVLVNTVDGVERGGLGLLPEVSVGDASQRDVLFVTYASAQLAALEERVDVQGIIGASFLHGHAVTFDLGQGTLTLQAYDPNVRDALDAELEADMQIAADPGL